MHRNSTGNPDAISRVEISARTKPEDAFAKSDPDKLSPKQRDIWYCRPYANSIAYQIREAIPGAQAEQVRRVEQSEGTVLSRISGLMWLISAAALLAAGFAVSAAMATAILERRGGDWIDALARSEPWRDRAALLLRDGCARHLRRSSAVTSSDPASQPGSARASSLVTAADRPQCISQPC